MADVEKAHEKSAGRALPAISLIAAVIRNWYCFPGCRAVAGVNVAVLPLTVIDPVTFAPPPASVALKLAGVTVLASTASENVTRICVARSEVSAPFAGKTAVTTGAVVSVVPGGDGAGLSSLPPQACREAATVFRVIAPVSALILTSTERRPAAIPAIAEPAFLHSIR